MQPAIVSVRAVDWGIYSEQMPADSDFQIVTGWIHGQIIRETDEFIAIAFQAFDDGGVRHVATIPKVCILERVEHQPTKSEGSPMIIGFTGHRDWLCNEQSLLRLEERYPGATWIHGGAPGFDTQAHDVALKLGKALGATLIVIRPDYDSYRPQVAPLMRNDIIVERCSILIACYDGRKTGGTYYTVNRAKQAGKPVGYLTPVERVKVPLKV